MGWSRGMVQCDSHQAQATLRIYLWRLFAWQSEFTSGRFIQRHIFLSIFSPLSFCVSLFIFIFTLKGERQGLFCKYCQVGLDDDMELSSHFSFDSHFRIPTCRYYQLNRNFARSVLIAELVTLTANLISNLITTAHYARVSICVCYNFSFLITCYKSSRAISFLFVF